MESSAPWGESADQTPFCPRCGTLLIVPDVGDVVCDKCDFTCSIRDMPAQTVVTRSYQKPRAAWLREYMDAEAVKAGGAAAEVADASKVVRAEVNETCPACSHPRMEYYALHLRGADEGQTIFWEVRAATCEGGGWC